MSLNKKHIQIFVTISGTIALGIIFSYFFFNPEAFTDFNTLAVSFGAYVSVFARKIISEKIGDFLGLDDNSKNINKLKDEDIKILKRLEDTESEGEEIRKQLGDTQEIIEKLLIKIEEYEREKNERH